MSETRPKVPKQPPRCPICKKPRSERYRPFCSARCRDIDLARWFNQAYAVPVVEDADDHTGEADEN